MQFIKGVCFGVLQIKPIELNQYSISDIWDAYLGYWNIEKLKKREEWEIARWVGYLSNGNWKKGTKVKDLGTFEWEKGQAGMKGTSGNAWTKAEIEELKKTHPMFKNGRK